MSIQARDSIKEGDLVYGVEEGILRPFFKQNPELIIDSKNFNTSISRKYIAEFELTQEELRLSNFHFPEKRLNEKMGIENKAKISKILTKVHKIDWFTGLLVKYISDKDKVLFANWKWFNLIFLQIEKPVKFEILEFQAGSLINRQRFNFKEIQQFRDKKFQLLKERKLIDLTVLDTKEKQPFQLKNGSKIDLNKEKAKSSLVLKHIKKL